MPALTRVQARDRLRSEYLDDAPAGRRWSDTALNRALYVAAVGVMEECARHRVTRVLRTTSGTTTSGALTVPKNAQVTSVRAVVGDARIALRQAAFREVRSPLQLTLEVEYVPGITEPTSDSHFLLNDPANTAIVDWPLLEELVLANAGVICFGKEPNPRLAGAKRAVEMYREQVLGSKQSPGWSTNPAPAWHLYEDLLRWGYDPQTGQVVISAVVQ